MKWHISDFFIFIFFNESNNTVKTPIKMTRIIVMMMMIQTCLKGLVRSRQLSFPTTTADSFP